MALAFRRAFASIRANHGGGTTVHAKQVESVEAGALATAVQNSYRVAAIEEDARPAVLDLSPASHRSIHGKGEPEAVVTFGVQEVGLHAPITGVAASASPLVGAGGDRIPAGQVSVFLSKNRLEAGEYGEVKVVVPMLGRRGYPYQGTVTVTSSAVTKTANLAIDGETVRLDQTVGGGARASVVASSGHTARAGGTVWLSDAVLHNPGSNAVTAHLFFMERDQANASARSKRVRVPAGGPLKLVDAEPYMWWCNNSGYATRPAGQKLPNPYGFFDMPGNVWEWVGDWYGSYPSSAVTDPTGPSSGSYRVARGGGWHMYAQPCRSANRNRYSPSDTYYDLGSRLARSQ